MPQKRRRRLRVWALAWLVNLGLWFLYVAKLNWPEAAAGVVAATFGTIGLMTFHSLELVRFRPRMRDLAEAWRIPLYVCTGTRAVVFALLRQLCTRGGASDIIHAVHFRRGQNDSASAARRALAVTFTTVTPNCIVLGINHRQRLLLYHQVVPAQLSPITIHLGARA